MDEPRRIEIRRILGQDRRHRVGGGLAFEGALAAEHLVEHRAKRKHVRAMIDREPAHLLGRHVAERPEHHAGVVARPPPRVMSAAAGFDRLRQSEVENLDLVVARDHHVLGLEIAMRRCRVRAPRPCPRAICSA